MGIESYGKEALINRIKYLEKKNHELERKISEEDFQLTERNKELKGIYQITQPFPELHFCRGDHPFNLFRRTFSSYP